jgi:hypothetical protein
MTPSRPTMHRVAALLTIGCLVAPAFGQDKAEIDPTKIIGSRELPKVTYIVPWKKPLPGDLAGRPPVSVIDEALAPLDRDVFRRQVRYDSLEQTHAGAVAPVAPPAAH